MRLPLESNWVFSVFPGMGCPARLVSSGLGSNESTCDTPPAMKQKITFLTLGVKCGAGLWPAKAFWLVSPAKASEPKPREQRRNISRREREGIDCIRLRQVNELLEVEEDVGEMTPRGVFDFARARGPGVRALELV